MRAISPLSSLSCPIVGSEQWEFNQNHGPAVPFRWSYHGAARGSDNNHPPCWSVGYDLSQAPMELSLSTLAWLDLPLMAIVSTSPSALLPPRPCTSPFSTPRLPHPRPPPLSASGGSNLLRPRGHGCRHHLQHQDQGSGTGAFASFFSVMRCGADRQ